MGEYSVNWSIAYVIDLESTESSKEIFVMVREKRKSKNPWSIYEEQASIFAAGIKINILKIPPFDWKRRGLLSIIVE